MADYSWVRFCEKKDLGVEFNHLVRSDRIVMIQVNDDGDQVLWYETNSLHHKELQHIHIAVDYKGEGKETIGDWINEKAHTLFLSLSNVTVTFDDEDLKWSEIVVPASKVDRVCSGHDGDTVVHFCTGYGKIDVHNYCSKSDINEVQRQLTSCDIQ
jgi:hypothetical protein